MSAWRRLLGAWRGTSPDTSVDWLIAGLGNPGARYDGTRHNVGRDVVTALAARHEVALDTAKFNARFGTGRIGATRACLAVTLTYMNVSGRAIGPLARFYRVPPERLLVVYDDLDLEPGTLRLRKSGGAGGHNGMRSLIDVLGTRDFPRLRVGIGRPPPGWDPVDFVLTRTNADERAVLEQAVERAVSAVETALSEGLDAAMNAFNTPEAR